MNNFEFSLPTNIKFGKDTHLETGKLMNQLGKKVLIHFGSDRIKKDGLLKQIEGLLEKEGLEYIEFGGVQQNPSVHMAEKGVALCLKENIDCILAIGGGSVVDSAKAIAMGVFSETSLWELFSGKCDLPKRALPLGVIVTIPATASEANGVSVLSNHALKEKNAIENSVIVPKFAILNPELTVTIPGNQTAIAAVDIFSHCFERYMDLRRESQLRDALCEATMKTVIDITPKLLQNLQDYQLRSEMMWAATLAHSDMLGTGGDFACHRLSHVLTSAYNLPHGMALGLIMPAWATYVYDQSPGKFEEFGRNIWGVDGGKKGILRMKDFISSLGLPNSVNEAGIKEYNPKELVEQGFSHEEEFLGGGLSKIYKRDAEEIFRLL